MTGCVWISIHYIYCYWEAITKHTEIEILAANTTLFVPELKSNIGFVRIKQFSQGIEHHIYHSFNEKKLMLQIAFRSSIDHGSMVGTIFGTKLNIAVMLAA